MTQPQYVRPRPVHAVVATAAFAAPLAFLLAYGVPLAVALPLAFSVGAVAAYHVPERSAR